VHEVALVARVGISKEKVPGNTIKRVKIPHANYLYTYTCRRLLSNGQAMMHSHMKSFLFLECLDLSWE